MRLPLLLLLGLLLAGCTPARETGDSNAPYVALADAAAHASLNAINRTRAAKSLEPVQLQSHGMMPNDTVDGRSALVAMYSIDPPYFGGRFTVYVFKDNNEVRVVRRD